MSRQFPAAPPNPSTPLMPVGNPSPPQTFVDRTTRWIEQNRNLLILGTAVAVSAGAGFYLYNRSSGDAGLGGSEGGASSSKKNKKKNKKKSKFVQGEGTNGPLLEEIKPEEKKPEVKQETDLFASVPQGDDLARMSEAERDTLGAQLKDQGNQLYSKTKFEQAVACYTKAIEVSVKRDAVFFSNRAACYTNYSPPQWTKVVDDCNEAIAIDKAYVKALRRRAGALEHLGRLEEASRDYTAIALIEHLGDDQANEAVERAIKNLAEKKLKEIMENHEFKLPARSFIRQYLSAFRPHSKPVLPAEPSQGDRTLDLAFDALAANDYDHAFSFVNEAIEQGISTKEGQAEAHSLRGVFKFLSSDSVGARDEFEKSISIHPTSQAWTKLASVHMELGHLEPGEKAKAFGDYEAAIQINPNDPDIYYQRGQINFVSEEWANAKEDYEKSTALDPDFIFSHIQAAVCQYKLENYSACFAAFRRILKQFPQRSEAFNYYGEILLEQGKFSEAVERFEQAAELEKDKNPPNVTPILNKAFTLVRWKQDIAGAEALCRKAHELDPECDIPVVAMGQFASQQSKLDEAIEWFEKHLKLARAEPDLMQALQFLEAAKAQKAFVQGYPEHAAVLSQQVRARAGL